MNPLNHPTDNLTVLTVLAMLAWATLILVVWAGLRQPDDQ